MIILHTAAASKRRRKERVSECVSCRRGARSPDAGSDEDGGGGGKEQGPAAAADANAGGGAALPSTRLPSSDSVPLIFREKMDVRLESQ